MSVRRMLVCDLAGALPYVVTAASLASIQRVAERTKKVTSQGRGDRISILCNRIRPHRPRFPYPDLWRRWWPREQSSPQPLSRYPSAAPELPCAGTALDPYARGVYCAVNYAQRRGKSQSKGVGMNKKPSRSWRSRLIDALWELLIALAIVSVAIAGGFFYAAHENDSWMPSHEMLQHLGWSVAGLGLGAAYLYLAVSTRRLERKISIPQLRQLLNLGQRWPVSLGISVMCFVFGLWSLWPVVQRYGLTLPPTRKWNVQPAAFQVVAGLVWMLWGASVFKLRTYLASRTSAALKVRLASYVLSIGMFVYGVVRFSSGLFVLFK
jgi:hypothetical protein